MSTIPFIAIAWFVYLVASVVMVLPVVLVGRHRVHWRAWELFAFVLPFTVWAALMFSDLSTGRKTLSNFVIEPGVLALVVAIGAVLRILLSKRMAECAASQTLLAVLSLGAVGVFWLTPAFPE